MKKKFLIKILLLFFLSPFFIFAQHLPRPLEVQYPQFVPQVSPPTTVEVPIPNYVKYIFTAIIALTGLIAFLALVYAGFIYLISGGTPEKIIEAKERFLAAFFGVLILLLSGLIIRTINPGFLRIEIKPPIPPLPPQLAGGLYLCTENVPIADYYHRRIQLQLSRERTKEEVLQLIEWFNEIWKKCFHVAKSGEIPKDWRDRLNRDSLLYLVPTYPLVYPGTDTPFFPPPYSSVPQSELKKLIKNYFAFVFEDENYRGNVRLIWVDQIYTGPTIPMQLKIDKAYSVIFGQVDFFPSPNWVLILYEEENLNKGFENACVPQRPVQKKCWWWSGQVEGANSCCRLTAAQSGEFWGLGVIPCTREKNCPRSLQIEPGRNSYIVMLTDNASEEGWIEDSAVFYQTHDNLMQLWYVGRGVATPCLEIYQRVRIFCPTAQYFFFITGKLF